jgi:hypothetical protein
MRNILLLFIFILSTISAFGQAGTSITYVDGFGTITLNYLDEFNGKRRYRGTDPGGTLTIYWTSTRWEISYNADVLYFSDASTALNPPNFTVGNWQNQPPNMPPLLGLSGTGTTSVLPVELIRFNVSARGGKNQLTWETASESNNQGFEIERSQDGIRFEKIGFVAGSSTTAVNQVYTFEDTNPNKGTSYYRLKQIDFDGNSEYFTVRSIKNGSKSTASISPTIVQSGSTARLSIESEAEEDSNYFVYSMTGQLTLQQNIQVQKGSNTYDLNIADLPPGVYVLKTLLGYGGPQAQQFVVQ